MIYIEIVRYMMIYGVGTTTRTTINFCAVHLIARRIRRIEQTNFILQTFLNRCRKVQFHIHINIF